MAWLVEYKMIARWFWIFCILPSVSQVLSQTVSLSIRDQSNNRFVFAGETNIELICQYSGFSDDSFLQINNNETLIGIGTVSLSEDYNITVDGDSAILTIKMASEHTAGNYECTVHDNTLGVSKSSSFNLEVFTVSMGPRCWSSMTLQNYIFLGQEFYADCFYLDTTDSFESKWTKILPNGTEIFKPSTELNLQRKKKRTLTITDVDDEDDGVLYKCSVTHKSPTSLIQLTPCEIGPVLIYEKTTTLALVDSSSTNPSLFTTRILPNDGTSSTRKQFLPNEGTPSTSKQFSGSGSVVFTSLTSTLPSTTSAITDKGTSKQFSGTGSVVVTSFTSKSLITTKSLPDKVTLGTTRELKHLSGTTKQYHNTSSVVLNDRSLFDGNGMYIILAIAVVVFIIILIIIVICLYCHKHSKHGDLQKALSDEENDLSKRSAKKPDPLSVYNELPFDKNGSYYDAPPSSLPEYSIAVYSAPTSSANNKSSEYVNGSFSSDKEGNRESFIILGPEDLVSTHL